MSAAAHLALLVRGVKASISNHPQAQASTSWLPSSPSFNHPPTSRFLLAAWEGLDLSTPTTHSKHWSEQQLPLRRLNSRRPPRSSCWRRGRPRSRAAWPPGGPAPPGTWPAAACGTCGTGSMVRYRDSGVGRQHTTQAPGAAALPAAGGSREGGRRSGGQGSARHPQSHAQARAPAGAHQGCRSMSSIVMRFLASMTKMRLSRSLHSGDSCGCGGGGRGARKKGAVRWRRIG